MVSWVEVKCGGPHGRRSRVESLINTHGRPLHVSVPQKLADGPQRFVAFPQHPQRAEPDLGRGWFGVFGTLEHKHDELIFAVSFSTYCFGELGLEELDVGEEDGRRNPEDLHALRLVYLRREWNGTEDKSQNMYSDECSCQWYLKDIFILVFIYISHKMYNKTHY